ncbi:MAG: hypothetical protein Q8Q09_24530 [Deltaproteobacteria bacterium]|nr:hypothetical protein [Deltaproteobacteria bacterium]
MRWRTQLAVVGALGALYLAGNVAFVRPVMDPHSVDRLNLAALEELVAREPTNAVALRELTGRYLDLSMPSQLVIDVAQRAPAGTQRDGKVCLNVARAHELLGGIEEGSRVANAALNRCANTPPELAGLYGCDVRVQTELALLASALDRMIQWHISPVTDPRRAALAHDIAGRPIRIGP